MMGHPFHIVTSLFTLAVTFGAGYMLITRPKQTNALVGSSVGAVSSITKAWEGR